MNGCCSCGSCAIPTKSSTNTSAFASGCCDVGREGLRVRAGSTDVTRGHDGRGDWIDCAKSSRWCGTTVELDVRRLLARSEIVSVAVEIMGGLFDIPLVGPVGKPQAALLQ